MTKNDTKQLKSTIKMTGVFIPIELLLDNSLSPFDKILLAYVGNFSEFYQKNETISTLFKVSVPTVTRSISSLVKKGLLSSQIIGRGRLLKSLVTVAFEPNQNDYLPNQNDYLPNQNDEHIYKNNKKIYKEKNFIKKDLFSYRNQRQYTQAELDSLIDDIDEIEI